MARHVTFVMQVKVRWWLRLYLYGVALTSYLTGMEPDYAKVQKWINRGVKSRLVRQSTSSPNSTP